MIIAALGYAVIVLVLGGVLGAKDPQGSGLKHLIMALLWPLGAALTLIALAGTLIVNALGEK